MTLRRDGLIRVRKTQKGVTGSAQFTIPAEMKRVIPDGALFRPEWQEDGILYRFIGVESELGPSVDHPDQPAWTKRAKS